MTQVMTPIFEDDTRSAVAWLNFAKPVKVDPDVPVGPNTLGEIYWPVEVSQDNKRVGYSLIKREDK